MYFKYFDYNLKLDFESELEAYRRLLDLLFQN